MLWKYVRSHDFCAIAGLGRGFRNLIWGLHSQRSGGALAKSTRAKSLRGGQQKPHEIIAFGFERILVAALIAPYPSKMPGKFEQYCVWSNRPWRFSWSLFWKQFSTFFPRCIFPFRPLVTVFHETTTLFSQCARVYVPKCECNLQFYEIPRFPFSEKEISGMGMEISGFPRCLFFRKEISILHLTFSRVIDHLHNLYYTVSGS